MPIRPQPLASISFLIHQLPHYSTFYSLTTTLNKPQKIHGILQKGFNLVTAFMYK